MYFFWKKNQKRQKKFHFENLKIPKKGSNLSIFEKCCSLWQVCFGLFAVLYGLSFFIFLAQIFCWTSERLNVLILSLFSKNEEHFVNFERFFQSNRSPLNIPISRTLSWKGEMSAWCSKKVKVGLWNWEKSSFKSRLSENNKQTRTKQKREQTFRFKQNKTKRTFGRSQENFCLTFFVLFFFVFVCFLFSERDFLFFSKSALFFARCF